MPARGPCDTALPEACLDASRPVVVDLRAFGEMDAPSREAMLECAEAVMRAPRQRGLPGATTPPSGLLDVGASPAPAGGGVAAMAGLFDQLPLVFLRAVHGAAGAEPPDSREEQSARRPLGRSAGTSRTPLLADELRPCHGSGGWRRPCYLPLGAFEGRAAARDPEPPVGAGGQRVRRAVERVHAGREARRPALRRALREPARCPAQWAGCSTAACSCGIASSAR